LARADATAYIRHRLVTAGGSPDLVDDEACAAIHWFAKGIPRLINSLADLSLVWAFADGRPIERGPINIHQVLNHVRRLSQNGFGKGVRFIETYDPSLPDVHGDRDQLIQVFLNLVKNACEVPGDVEREIELSTAYRHGLRLAVPGQQTRVNLPLVVTVRDNGRGVSDEIRSHLFDAFVTNKPTGTGLGLALVAKIINDHGGAIEFDSEPGRTSFRVMLPLQFPKATP